MPSPSFVPVIRSSTQGDFTADGDITAGGIITSNGVLLNSEMGPADHGFETWTHDPYAASSSVAAVNGRIYAVKLPLRRTRTLASMWWAIASSGVTPTAGQNFVGVYTPAGVQLNSLNVDANVTGSGPQESVFSAALNTSFVWSLFLFNAATPPTLVRGSSFEGTPNINLPTNARRAAVVASGATALPASFDPATLTTTNCLTFFAALETTP